MLKKKMLSVGYAMRGFRVAFIEEHNFQFHVAAAIVAIILALLLEISAIEWLFIIAAISAVMTAELLNTALEEICDMLKTSHDPHIAKIKDLAAAAVMTTSTGALIIGCIIFIPRLLTL